MRVKQGTRNPLVVGLIPVVATNPLKSSVIEQGIRQNRQSYLSTKSEQGISISKAIKGFLLSCKVGGKSYGTIECYSDKLKGFLWYARNYNWPDDVHFQQYV